LIVFFSTTVLSSSFFQGQGQYDIREKEFKPVFSWVYTEDSNLGL